MKHPSWHIEDSSNNLLQQLSSNKQNLLHPPLQPITKSQSAHQSPTYFLAPVKPPKRSHHTFLAETESLSQHNLYNQLIKKQKKQTQTQNIQTKKVNRKLLNLLYLQDINGVNPYIETLHELYNNPGDYDEEEVKKAKELCYIGIGKNLVAQNKISVPPYSRVNLLIREFMIDVITEEIKELQRRYPKRVYIQCNDRALGYNTRVFNEELYQHISKEDVESVINETNKIIEKQFISFKKKKEIEISLEVKVSFWVSILGIVLLVVYVQFYKSRILMILAWVLISLSILLNAVSLVIRERGFHQSQNIIDQIQRKLVDYLSEQNAKNRMCKWRCGKDFYWLEIELLKG